MRKVTVDEAALRRYIEKVIDDAHVTCERENTAKYDFRIIGKYLLFALDCKYRRVRVRIFHRLFINLPKNFYLNFQLVWPYSMRESDECWHAVKFDVSGDIDDMYNAIGYWCIFGTPYIIRFLRTVRIWPTDFTNDDYVEVLRANGYSGEHAFSSKNGISWEEYFRNQYRRYASAFDKSFGVTPSERGNEIAATLE